MDGRTVQKSLSGITVIEMVLILVIVIALLLIFKNQLINLINTIFDKIISESSGSDDEKGGDHGLLSMVFVLLVSFVLGMLEVSVIQTSKSMSRLTVDRAVFSLFGGYQSELFEEYMCSPWTAVTGAAHSVKTS